MTKSPNMKIKIPTLIATASTTLLIAVSMAFIAQPPVVSAGSQPGIGGAQCANKKNCNQNNGGQNQNNQSDPACGKGDSQVKTKIDLGCNGAHKNPIIDLAFALIRFLSFGVGVIVVASIVYAGVMYTMAEGNPEKSAQAKSRIQNSLVALMLYLFIFAIVQYLVPGGLF